MKSNAFFRIRLLLDPLFDTFHSAYTVLPVRLKSVRFPVLAPFRLGIALEARQRLVDGLLSDRLVLILL